MLLIWTRLNFYLSVKGSRMCFKICITYQKLFRGYKVTFCDSFSCFLVSSDKKYGDIILTLCGIAIVWKLRHFKNFDILQDLSLTKIFISNLTLYQTNSSRGVKIESIRRQQNKSM